MYSPTHFQITDRETILDHIRKHSFATLISQDALGTPIATHLPVLHQVNSSGQDVLVTHLARANPQWQYLAPDREVLTTFLGPHAYISPGWYQTRPMVPTWNYATVHIYGTPRLIDQPVEFQKMLRDLVDFFEASQPEPYGPNLTDEYIQRLLPGIVGIEISITRIEASFKLSQNRNPADRTGVIAALATSADQTDREVAALMQRTTG